VTTFLWVGSWRTFLICILNVHIISTISQTKKSYEMGFNGIHLIPWHMATTGMECHLYLLK
jgi:hypothetical protein